MMTTLPAVLQQGTQFSTAVSLLQEFLMALQLKPAIYRPSLKFHLTRDAARAAKQPAIANTLFAYEALFADPDVPVSDLNAALDRCRSAVLTFLATLGPTDSPGAAMKARWLDARTLFTDAPVKGANEAVISLGCVLEAIVLDERDARRRIASGNTVALAAIDRRAEVLMLELQQHWVCPTKPTRHLDTFAALVAYVKASF